jgi:osmoprotectant transport system ATP-binding protein
VAVDHLSLEIPDRSITVLVGPSGCGKTTTLRMINRMVEPSEGTILLDGKDIQQQPVNTLRRSMGYVIQNAGLFQHRTILDNIATVPRMLGWGKEKSRARRCGAGACRGSAGAADGRAVLGRRPRGAQGSAG